MFLQCGLWCGLCSVSYEIPSENCIYPPRRNSMESEDILSEVDNFWAILWEKNWGHWTLLHVGLNLIRVLSLAVMLIGDSGQGIISNWIKIFSFSCFQMDTVCVSFSLQIWLLAGCIEFGQNRPTLPSPRPPLNSNAARNSVTIQNLYL